MKTELTARAFVTLKSLITILFLSIGLSGTSQETDDSVADHSESEEQHQAIINTIEELGAKVEAVDETPIHDLYVVQVPGPDLFYVTGTGKHFIYKGNMYERGESAGSVTDLTAVQKARFDARRNQARWEIIQGLDPDESINFRPDIDEVPEHAIVYVFTDITCGYCRLLHQNMEGYNEAGIEIRYLAFPRAGVDSPAYDQLVSAWCSDDPKAAITLLKNNKKIEPKVCDNPVAEQYELGKKMRVTGTPALVLFDGSLVPGFVEPDKLVQRLEQFESSDS